MTGIELSNYENWNQFNQSYRERVVINLVQTCSKHFLQKYCVELPTSKIHAGLNTGPKLGKPMSKRPEIRYLTSPKRINANGGMSRDFLPI
ncbi:hypothetical protein QL285_021527 [Trifolium repens]|nr:hypothetical protein QL285_021527 [Trifolium repens]